MKKKVAVGMSGGVDSSVAAYLLQEQGYDVIGVTMQIWQDECRETVEENGGCCGISAVSDARRVADKLSIPYYVLNFKQDFQQSVIDYFIREYENGRTPNPCIACNRYVKWESLLKKALDIGADYIATGHYAQVKIHPQTNRNALCLSVTAEKDQTYALYNLTQQQLAHTLMPVGAYRKDEIRAIAEKIGLSVANKPDSQEICFVPDNDYASFIQQNSDKPVLEGNYVDIHGKVLGRHKGIIHYTIGQRKGLGIALGKPVYVCELRTETNEVVLGNNEDLFRTSCIVTQVNYMALDQINEKKRVLAKIRYNHKAVPCWVERQGEHLLCTFEEPQRALTPGQAFVMYEDGWLLGGGVIDVVR